MILLCLTVLLLILGAFWAGRMIEQRSQLGRLLASAPSVEQLQTAIRQTDSLGMQLMLQMGRLRRH